jgi:hypothetical protein
MPRAKRRLLIEGPLDAGRDAFRDAVIIVAGELRLNDVSEEDAVAACKTIPFAADSTPRHKVLKSVRDFVRWTYNPPDGKPLLTGCPSAPHHSLSTGTSRLRKRFEPYCDAECQRTCSMRRATLMPALVLAGSAYVPILESTLWTSRKGLGASGKAVWEMLAALAVVSGGEDVQASSRFLTLKLGGQYPARTVGELLTKLQEWGLVTLLNKQKGNRLVHVRDADWVRKLEVECGTRAAAAHNRASAARESLEYTLWLNEWDDANELVAGCGPIG